MNYYDLDDEGAKSRSAMTSWENPNGTWEDEITIGNEIVVDDRKRKIFTGSSTKWNEQKEIFKVTHSKYALQMLR